MRGFNQLITAGSFMMGLGLAAVTMLSFKSYAEGHGTFRKPLATAMMAAALIGCPTFLRMAHDTLEPQSVEATNASQTRSGALQPKAQVQIEQEQDFTTGRKPDGRKGGF